MPAEELEKTLNAHPFAAGLPPADIRLIAACAGLQRAGAGDYVWRQGDRNVEAYLLVDGEIAFEITVPHEGKLTFESIHAGEVAGCTALFHHVRWGFDGRAATPVRVVALKSRCLRAAIDQDHEFGYRILQRCTQSLVRSLDAGRAKLVSAHGATLP